MMIFLVCVIRENNAVEIPHNILRVRIYADTPACFSSSKHGSLSDGEPRDYVMPGPQPPVPANAVVDNSRKKDKKKYKETAEQKPVDDQYALVDKSKKKKKNEVDNTYAEVDMSKKSKKVCRPLFLL